MTSEKAMAHVKRLAGLYQNEVTQELGKYLCNQFCAFSDEAVRKAIDAHRGKCTKLDPPNLLEGCRAAEREAETASENTKREGSVADIYRRQNPQMANRGDVEVILRVHRGHWSKCSQSAGYRTRFASSARHQVYQAILAEPGADSKECWERAERLAESIFSEPADFNLLLSDLRGELAQ